MTQIAASSASARLSAFRRFLARLLCAIVVSLWSAVVACSQAVPPLPLPEALRAHVKDERFDAVTSIKGLPVGVHLALGNLFGSGALEEVGTEFQVTDVNPRVPPRRLVTAGCSIEHCLVYYERGSIPHTWHVALFRWTAAETLFEWGGTAPAGLRTIDDVRKAVLSGAVKGIAAVPVTSW
jgi:hypothetical protein